MLGRPERYIHAGNREIDINELFCLAEDLGANFLVRLQANRLADTPATTAKDTAQRVFAQLSATPWAGQHHVLIGQDETAVLKVKFASIRTLPPVGKQKRYASQLLTYIHALETDPPAGRPPIDWRLVTNLPIAAFASAVEKLGWYALRWKIETFHKVMKSGCRAEETRLETSDRLAKFLALIAVVSWRIFFLTMTARNKPDVAPSSVFTSAEINVLDQINASRPAPRLRDRTLAAYLLQMAMLDCYARRLPQSQSRSATREYRRMARISARPRYRPWHTYRLNTKMWVIESLGGGLRKDSAGKPDSGQFHQGPPARQFCLLEFSERR